jgi:hypothetical protein
MQKTSLKYANADTHVQTMIQVSQHIKNCFWYAPDAGRLAYIQATTPCQPPWVDSVAQNALLDMPSKNFGRYYAKQHTKLFYTKSEFP